MARSEDCPQPSVAVRALLRSSGARWHDDVEHHPSMGLVRVPDGSDVAQLPQSLSRRRLGDERRLRRLFPIRHERSFRSAIADLLSNYIILLMLS